MIGKPKILKRQLKLRELKYHIDGVETNKPLIEVASAVIIGAVIALFIICIILSLIN